LRTVIFAAALAALPACAQAADLTPQAAAEVVAQVTKGLDTYLDPTVAKRAQQRLQARLADYKRLDSRQAFAEAVSKDLYDVSHDGHLKVSVQTVEAGRGSRLTDEQQALVDKRIAYGFMSARRLPGNIGYLKLRYFEQGEEGAAMIDTVMGLLKYTDALIIDLRENSGGGGASDTELLGHLSHTPIPMAEVTWRNADGTTDVMQRQPRKPAGGALYPDKPIYVLTAKRTFSAAEEFVYDLKAAGRATLVGETTGGGANPANRPVPLSYGLRVFIPNGRVEHPTTHSNWEGVGIAPDIVVPVDQALTTAYGKALAAAAPTIATALSEREREAAIADPKATLLADQAL
jgi:C-terminal processing protease CtpA/Prc